VERLSYLEEAFREEEEPSPSVEVEVHASDHLVEAEFQVFPLEADKQPGKLEFLLFLEVASIAVQVHRFL